MAKSLVEIKPIVHAVHQELKLDAIIRRLVAEEAVEVRTDYEKTTRTWDKRPVFIIKFADNHMKATVGTDNKIYEYVDEGTRPHIIKPKRPGYPLRFNTPFKPKTQVMQIKSGSGFTGTNTVRAMLVHHPGTKARKFTPVILRAHNRMFAKRLQQEITRMAKQNE